VVSVFWAFANSINSPDEAKNSYGFMVSGSKLGGMLSAGCAWLLVTMHRADGTQYFSDVLNHQILLVSASLLLLMVPLIIWCMIRKIPSAYLHGYEAVYQVEKKREEQGTSRDGVLAGLWMFLRYPYVLGIFGMSFFYETVSTILSYLSVKIAKETGSTVSESLSYLLEIIFWTHAVGFVISLVGTSVLFRKLGTRRCLLLIPTVMGLILLYYMLNASSAQALIVAFVAMRSINYAFSWPLRESLYIPTVKDIKFKSKSWIDAFGSKLAKSTGSFFNIMARFVGPAYYMTTYAGFFAAVVGCWMVTAFLLGRRFDRAVQNEEVIGADAVE
jgi:AAA family ATP:ADP antiporter